MPNSHGKVKSQKVFTELFQTGDREVASLEEETEGSEDPDVPKEGPFCPRYSDDSLPIGLPGKNQSTHNVNTIVQPSIMVQGKRFSLTDCIARLKANIT